MTPETQRAVERLVAAIDMADRYEIGGTSFGDGLSAAMLDHADVLKVVSALSEASAREAVNDWSPIETAPKDGTPFYARHQSPYRFQPYKPSSEQYRRGQRGRWQTMNEYGGWENCPAPVGDWKAHPDFPARTTPIEEA